jgi:5-methylcytosine-specific restriction endonuclease McrA
MRVEPAVWRQVFKRDGGMCRYCGDDLLSSFSRYWCATVDHVHAVAAAGHDGAENLVLACPACNGLLSRASHLKTFEDRLAFVRQRREAEMGGYAQWMSALRPASARPTDS